MKKTKELILVLIIIFSLVSFSKVGFFSNKVFANTVGETVGNSEVKTGTGSVEFEYGAYSGETTASGFQKIRMLATASQDTQRYYYNQLKPDSSRNYDLSKNLYNELLKDTTGVGTTTLALTGYRFDITEEEYNNLNNTANELYLQNIFPYICDAIEAFDSDNPELYWYYFPGASYKFNYPVNSTSYYIEFTEISVNSKIDERSDYSSFNSKIDEIVESIDGTSTYEILEKCHDYIGNNVMYSGDIGNSKIEHTAYGAMIGNDAVCDGQAKMFKILCDRKNIPCIYVPGDVIKSNGDSGSHAWNYVYHEDENKWYAIDVTWDNLKIYGSGPRKTYFMVGKNTAIDEDTTFNDDHIPGMKHFDSQTYTPILPELSTTEYEAFSGEFNINPRNTTAESVTVTVSVNRELQEKNGWTLSDNRKTMTKVYTENASEDFYIYNTRGEKLRVQYNISNVVAPVVEPNISVVYSSQDITNQNVIANIVSNVKLQPLDGWDLSEDKLSLTKEFSTNDTLSLTVLTESGASEEVNVVVNNIDKNAPSASVTYRPEEGTTDNVTVTITANEKIQPVQGWELSDDQKTLTKIFSENGTETVTISDLAGNTVTKNINVSNINDSDSDNVKPTLQASYSSIDATSGKVVIIITSNEEIGNASSQWSYADSSKKVIKYLLNPDDIISIDVYDLAGNKSSIEVNVSSLLPKANYRVSYSTKEKTNKDVNVTITSDSEMKPVEGWTLSTDKKKISKTFSENYSGKVSIENLLGVSSEVDITVNNIDKVKPKLTVNYSDLDEYGQITVTISSNEMLSEKDGWTLSSNKLSLSRVFSANVEDEIIISDLAGNEETIEIKIDKINSNHNSGAATQVDSTPNEGATPSYSGKSADDESGTAQEKTVENDGTMSNEKFSDTGAFHGVVVATILVFAVSGVVFYRKYRGTYR